jgi:hypothetical protein
MSTEKFTVTLYGLFLADRDSTTGWFRPGYVAQSITMAVVPRSATRALMSVGKHARLDGLGFTEYDVREGDVVGDTHGDYWTIEAIKKWPWGNQPVYYECDLSERLSFPWDGTWTDPDHPANDPHFFGFEVIETGVREFEDGFERGWLL